MNQTNPNGWCNSKEHIWRPSRREFMFVGLLGTFGMSLPNVLKAEAKQAAAGGAGLTGKAGAAKSVINIYLPGGFAHQETFDPKIYAPIEYRGPLSSIKTSVEGVHFSENLVQTAKIADKITVVRSMTHGEAAHERGTHNMFTGYRPSPALQYPSIGSVVSHELGSRENLPPYVCIPSQPNTFAGTGYLGSAFGPFSLGSDPANGNFSVRDLTLPKGIDDKRFADRRNMRSVVDAHFSALEKSDALDGMDSFYQRAYSMISSEKARDAFSIDKEPAKLRDEYGRNTAGQRMLLARRLVESGVRFVSLTYGGWDHHDNIAGAMRNTMPSFDQAYAALIRDLDQRGMLDSTLVMITTEFGRTPMINKTAGRDHWPKVFSIVLAGGGIKRGYVHGSSDATGGEPEENPLTVANFAATVYNQMGIDSTKALMAPGGRPTAIVYEGEVVKSLLA
ncbi:MAG TPA: DUF1501 domain-containing protein [Roseimicrobium sp.]|nr:DUF1501 domain-containing protein [Roseimicrobium sp.]